MTILSREDILNADDIKTEEIEIPEWGGSVMIKVMTGEERDHLEASMLGDKPEEKIKALRNLRAKFVSICVCNEDGERLFTEADVLKIGKKSGTALDTLLGAIRKLNGMTEEEEEEMVKNLGGILEDDSDSNSV